MDSLFPSKERKQASKGDKSSRTQAVFRAPVDSTHFNLNRQPLILPGDKTLSLLQKNRNFFKGDSHMGLSIPPAPPLLFPK